MAASDGFFDLTAAAGVVADALTAIIGLANILTTGVAIRDARVAALIGTAPRIS